MKSGCIDFFDFVNKLFARATEDDQIIVQTNHVTWLITQIIRIDNVMAALNSDLKKVVLIFLKTFLESPLFEIIFMLIPTIIDLFSL